MPSHILDGAQVLFFKPFSDYALSDLFSVFVFGVEFPERIVKV